MSTAALKAAVTGMKERTPYEKFRDRMTTLRGELKPLLGSDTAIAQFERVVLNAVQHNPDLLVADQRTLLLACMKAAQDRLLPDGREAVFNIYNTKIKGPDGADKWVKAVQYLPMVRGLIKSLWDSGHFTMLDAVAVYEKDHFKYQRGDEPKIEHVPYEGADDPGNVRAAYFIATMTNGEKKREVMFRRDIEKARKASKTPEKGPWVDWYDQQAIKSVIHRAYKQLPTIPAVENVIEADLVASGYASSELDPGTQPLQLAEHAGGEAIAGQSVRVDHRETVGKRAASGAGEPQSQAASSGTSQSSATKDAGANGAPKKGALGDYDVKLKGGGDLFQSRCAPEVGLTLKFKGAEYVVETFDDAVVVVTQVGAKPAAATAAKKPTAAATPEEKVRAKIEGARTHGDFDVADLQLDEASSMIDELPEQLQGELRKLLKTAVDEVAERRRA